MRRPSLRLLPTSWTSYRPLCSLQDCANICQLPYVIEPISSMDQFSSVHRFEGGREELRTRSAPACLGRHLPALAVQGACGTSAGSPGRAVRWIHCPREYLWQYPRLRAAFQFSSAMAAGPPPSEIPILDPGIPNASSSSGVNMEAPILPPAALKSRRISEGTGVVSKGDIAEIRPVV